MTKLDVNKFALYIAIILITIIGSTDYLMYSDNKLLLQQKTERYAEDKLQSLVKQSAYFFHHFENQLIDELVNTIGSEAQVNYISVVDVSGKKQFSYGQKQLNNSQQYRSDIVFNDELLGHAVLELDISNLKSDIDNVFIRTLISFLLSIIFVGSLIYLLIRINVLTQFEKIRRESEKIQEEHFFINSIINTSSNLVLVLDCDGNFVLNNKSCELETGVNLEQSKGKPIWDFFDIKCDEIALKEFWLENKNLCDTLDDKLIIKKCVSIITLNEKEKIFEWQFSRLMDSDSHTKYIIGSGTDITSHFEEKKELSSLAHHDPLTSLPNRVMFQEKLQQIEKQCKEEASSFSLMYIDLDNFKPINDSLGHDAGDYVLVSVAKRLQKLLRNMDLVARLGGDEFAVILTSISERKHAGIVAQKIIDALSKPIDYKNHECHIGASIGLSWYPDDAELLDDLIKNADKAMYQAKEAGKNIYRFFEAE